MTATTHPTTTGQAEAMRLRPKQVLGRWYYFKKSFSLFPGIVKAKSGDFLVDYYRRRAAAQSLPRKAINALTFLGFRAWIPWRARKVAAKYGLDKAWTERAIEIARVDFADPNDIALFRIERPGQLKDYMRRFENANVNKIINPANWRPECVLANKIDFYERCARHGVPHPLVRALIINGVPTPSSLPSAGRLASKPAGGEGGTGFRMLDATEADVADLASFSRFLKAKLGDTHGEWLVQDCITPHPDLAGIAMKALPTCRITTLYDEQGEPEIVTHALRFPSDPDSHVDNIKSGGLMAPIDLATGKLGVGCRGRGLGEFPTHPVTGAPIEGLQLPMWEQAKALVIDTHKRAFREYTMVGWDVSLTPNGPILIEGNGKPCMIVAQRANRKGVGATRFGELLAYHLAR